MLCKNPYLKGVMPFGCGQCLPCRLNRRRLWTHRLFLESLLHSDFSFVTLTYDEEHLPEGGALKKEDASLWLKRIRKAVYPRKLRFYLVGEYGDQTERPHFHVALFGYPSCFNYKFNDKVSLFYRSKCQCMSCSTVRSTWSKGKVDVGTLTLESAQYIAGYVTKKMTKADDPRLKGRPPEFARMSLRPGIGAGAMVNVGEQLLTNGGCELILREGDVPTALKQGKKSLPLGRYLRKKLREFMGFPETGGQKEGLKIWEEEMREVFKEALNGERIFNPEVRQDAYKRILLQKNAQKVLNLESKAKIFKKGGSL